VIVEKRNKGEEQVKSIEMRFTENKIVALLRQRGYKLTPQRRQIINSIALSHEHLTPSAIYQKVREQYPGIGQVTIYRTLDILAEMGLICEVHAEGGCRSYLLRSPTVHHHHLICSDCGAVVDFTNCDLIELEHKLSQKTGFAINSHLLEFSGRCPNCQFVGEQS
jgi:Fur family ferric uptake transcriptional regulator